MKKRILLIATLSPFAANAEATNGYSYGFGDDVTSVLVIGGLLLVAIVGIIRMMRKGRK